MRQRIELNKTLEYGNLLMYLNKSARDLGWTVETQDKFDSHTRLNIPFERIDYAGTEITLSGRRFKKAKIKVYREDFVDHFYISRKRFTPKKDLEEYIRTVKKYVGPRTIIGSLN